VPTQQLPMFGTTLIMNSVEQSQDGKLFRFRRASSDEWWTIIVPEDSPMIEHLARPGACFALVELASVGQVASRGRY